MEKKSKQLTKGFLREKNPVLCSEESLDLEDCVTGT